MASLSLTTKERIKVLFPQSTIQNDMAIDQLIAVVSKQFERFLDVDLLKTERSEVITVLPNQTYFWLRSFPIDTGAQFVVKNDQLQQWTTVAAIDSSNYSIDTRRGKLQFRDQLYSLVDGPGALQVTYTGGLATTTANLIASGDYADLCFACEQQVLHNLMRKPNFGSPQRTVGGGGQSFEDDKGSPFIPVVREILEFWVRG